MRDKTMTIRTILFFASIAIAVGVSDNAFAQEYRLGAGVPGWVAPIPADVSGPLPEDGTADGLYTLLLDTQVNFAAPVRERFFHEAFTVANSAGLENAGTLTINFDPSYEKLAIHSVVVRRGGISIDQTGKAKITLLQREQNLEYRIYDGSKTLSLILSDLRVGDVIEYRYTLSGANPVFAGRAFDYRELQGASGCRRSLYRVLMPLGKNLSYKDFAHAVTPAVNKTAAATEYIWDLKDLPALLPDEKLPDWYSVYPAVQVTEFGDWQAVSAWAGSVYRPLFAEKEGVAALGRKLATGLAHAEDKVTAFITFVQNEIRYLGIEIGMNSHQPNPPDLVIERRFGDCKDKALLLAALCRGQGVPAWPVLVNSYMKGHTADFLPSPGAFNHVITLIRLDGRDYWIDPTATHQASRLACISQSDLLTGLVIRDGETALAAIPPPSPTEPTIVMREDFDISQGNRQPATLVVTTVYTGDLADGRRGSFAENSLPKIQKDFLAYYSDFFTDIRSADKLKVTDDRDANRLTIVESYAITKPWAKDDDKDRYDFSLFPEDLGRYLRKPKSIARTAPYAIAHPLFFRAIKNIRLPRGRWDLKNESYAARNDAFSFSTDFTYARSVAECRFEYRSLSDSVPAGAMRQYADDLEAINKKINQSLFTDDPDTQDFSADNDSGSAAGLDASSIAYTVIFLASPLLSLVVFALIRAGRRSRRRMPVSYPLCYRCGIAADRVSVKTFKICSECNPPRRYCPACIESHQHY